MRKFLYAAREMCPRFILKMKKASCRTMCTSEASVYGPVCVFKVEYMLLHALKFSGTHKKLPPV